MPSGVRPGDPRSGSSPGFTCPTVKSWVSACQVCRTASQSWPAITQFPSFAMQVCDAATACSRSSFQFPLSSTACLRVVEKSKHRHPGGIALLAQQADSTHAAARCYLMSRSKQEAVPSVKPAVTQGCHRFARCHIQSGNAFSWHRRLHLKGYTHTPSTEAAFLQTQKLQSDWLHTYSQHRSCKDILLEMMARNTPLQEAFHLRPASLVSVSSIIY